MRYMEHIDGVLGLIDKEFAEMEASGKFRSKDDIELVYKMMDIVKDASEYCKNCMEMGDDYSENSYAMTDSHYDGTSYARGRSMPRNSMGQFTSRAGSYMGGNPYRGMNYSRADAKINFIDQLYDMMQNAPDEHTHDRIQRMIHEMEQQ